MRDAVHRAFAEFLALPTLIIGLFLLLSAVTFVADRTVPAWLENSHAALRSFLSDSVATAQLLSTIAGSLITVTSITMSLLLVAVQQAAGSLTAQVFDQFLRRRHNQFHFGFFIGLSLFALITLGSVNASFNPVFGAAAVFALTVIALFLLIVLLYAVIDQMRPIEIIEMIHDQTLSARHRQLALVAKTSAVASDPGAASLTVRAKRHGFVTAIHLDAIAAATRVGVSHSKVIFQVSMGSYVSYHDVLAEVRAASPREAHELSAVVLSAVHLERQRDIVVDPAYGIAQLEDIAWTSISTAQSNPAPGILTINAFRDLMARWSDAGAAARDANAVVVYADNTVELLMDAFETLAVVSSESMQHQTLSAVLDAFVYLFDRLPVELTHRVEDVVMRILPALGDFVLTRELDQALSSMTVTLTSAGRVETATALDRAHRQFAQTVGRFGSRSTRGTRGGSD